MHLYSLHLCNFRRFKDEYIEFSPGINHFIGDNAQGKTTIIEALYLLSTGHSFRTHHLQELIRTNSSGFAISLQFERHLITQQIKLLFDGKEMRIFFNDTRLHHLHQLLGIVQGVVISSEDLSLIKGPPDNRRQMLDLHLSYLDPLYHHHSIRYKRALKQRNMLIKNRSLSAITPFEVQLAKSAAYLVLARSKAIQELTLGADKILQTLSLGEERLHMHYQSSVENTASVEDIQNQYMKKYADSRQKDMEIGYTSLGPHRDDLYITLNDLSAKSYASEGQKRTLCNALRLAQFHIFEEKSQEPVFLCIDDIKMSLDTKRSDSLLHTLMEYGQLFLTSPTPLSNLDSITLFSVSEEGIKKSPALLKKK